MAIVEPDFLPGLLLPAATSRCAAVQASGAYPAAVRYALTRLHAIPNVYVYLDASHHGVVGHPDNPTSPGRTAATASATGATRPAPGSARGPRPSPPPGSTRTRGSSRRASPTARG
ncbi:glycoside hydrolase family 6 protein [Microbispora siamensis]